MKNEKYLKEHLSLKMSEPDMEDNEHGAYGFMFIFESDGKFHRSLDEIHPKDGDKVTIHPVYYSDYDNTMASEVVIWNEKEKKYVTTSEDGSWLDTLKEFPDMIYEMDHDQVVFHGDGLGDVQYFHCDGCLLNWFIGDVKKVSLVPDQK